MKIDTTCVIRNRKQTTETQVRQMQRKMIMMIKKDKRMRKKKKEKREKKLNKMKEKIDRMVKRKPTAGTNGEVENLPDPQRGRSASTRAERR